MATAPRPGVGKRAEAEEWKILINFNGKTYTLRPSELSALDADAVRRQTPFTQAGLIGAVGEEPARDLDVTAALLWLARRQAGERTLAYADVAGEVTYGSDFTPGVLVEDGNSPEA